MTPVLTRERSQRIVESYAGYTGKSKILEAIWNKAKNEGRQLTIDDIPDWPWPEEELLPLYVNDSAGLFAYIDQGPIARTRMPWTNENHPTLGAAAKQYYLDQANQPGMTPEQFDRLHFNYWVSPTTAFLPIEWWHQCQDNSISELTQAKTSVLSVPSVDDPDYNTLFTKFIDQTSWQSSGKSDPVVMAIDASVSGDCTALTLVSRHPQRYADVALRAAYKWDPPRGGKIDYERTTNQLSGLSLWQQIIDSIMRYNVVEIAYDEWQLHHLMNQIRNLGLAWCRAFGQATPRDIADKQLYDLIKLRRIGYNPQSNKIDIAAMEQHLKNAARQQRAKEDTKLHIVKASDESKIDLTVALSMACGECLRLDM